MKKLICLLAAAALLVCCALPAFAEASGVSRADYTITAYSVDATLHENNTVTQTERITVDFAVPSRVFTACCPSPCGWKRTPRTARRRWPTAPGCGTLP